MAWPMDANEQRWSGDYSHDPVGSSLSHQQPMDPVFVAPVPYFQAPLPPRFTQAHAADGYPHLQNHFAGGHSATSRHRNSLPANSFNPPRSNGTFFEESRAFVPSTDDFGDDGRYRRRQPPRRSAHWEDDPYPASSSLRDSLILQATLALNSHHCFPELGRSSHSPCSPTSCHPQTHNPTINGHGYDCNLHGSPPSCNCGVPHSTLTHVGPSTCRCYHHAPCGHSRLASAEPTTLHPLRPKNESRALEKSSENQISGGQRQEQERGKGGVVGRWLTSLLFTAKRVSPRFPKQSKNGAQLSEVEPKAVTAESGRLRIETSGLRRASDPSSVATAGASSGLREVSPTTETIISTSVPTHDHEVDSQFPPQVIQTIPRAPSSASTCQCYPPSITLHVTLRHNPFETHIIQWDISRPPATHLYWNHKPEEILANKRPVVYPDFFGRYATDPPIRHMFINALGDFPLARCRGDPNPSRSKNRERHMYSSGQGDERVEMRTLPWPIRITGTSEGNGYIMLKDVFRAIHNNFRQYIPVEEYDSYTTERKRVIVSAYHVRQKQLEEVRAWSTFSNTASWVSTEHSEGLIEEGIIRCDYLGTQLVFRGLEVSPDKEGYTLFLGPFL